MVLITDFLNIDMRVGKIVAVEDLQTRKPMYQLDVDVGELGIKHIAAGVKEFYTKEELLDKSVILVANLDPKKIGDFVSEGMILAAEENGTIALLSVDKALSPGSKVR